MSTFTIYDKVTGRILKHFTGTDLQLSRNVPEGCEAVLGRHDGLSKRIDPETGQPVDWQPPRPTSDHDWNSEQRRWVPNESATQKRMALAEIRRLERNQQPRAQREAILGKGTERLQEIEDRIIQLRAIISTAARPGQT